MRTLLVAGNKLRDPVLVAPASCPGLPRPHLLEEPLKAGKRHIAGTGEGANRKLRRVTHVEQHRWQTVGCGALQQDGGELLICVCAVWFRKGIIGLQVSFGPQRQV